MANPYEGFQPDTEGTSNSSAYAGFEPLAAEPAAPSMGLLESFGRGAAEGATFGFDDKLGMSKEARAASKKANPWTHFMGEMVGAVAPMAVATPLAAVKGAGLLAKGARALATPFAVGEANTLGQGVKQGVKLGATYGGLSGAGHADVKDEDTLGDALTKRGVSAITGAGIGAGLGAPLGAAGYGISKVAQSVLGARAAAKAETKDAGSGALVTFSRGLERDKLTPDDLITNIRAEFPDDTATAGVARRFWGPANVPGPQRGEWTGDMVEETVRRALAGQEADTISTALIARSPNGKGPMPDAVQTMLDELAARHLGPVNLVDRAALARTGAGQNTQMQMRAAAATPGEATSIAREGLLERQVGAPQRIQQWVERTIGSGDFDGVATLHQDKFASAGQRAYGTAFANEKPFNLAPIFDTWEAQFEKMRGVIPDTIRQRLRAMQTEITNPDGSVTRIPPQDLQGFMYAREGLRDIIGELPKGNNLKRHLTKFYNEITDEVGTTNPLWKEANSIWRDGMAGNEALEAGAKMSMRLNTKSREGLREFDDARRALATAIKEERAAGVNVKPVKKTKKNPTPTQPTPTPAQQVRLDTAQARREAAEARLNLFKVGLVRSINDMLMNKGETTNLTRELLLPGARQILRQVLGKEDAEQFFRALQAEAAMQRTYQSQFGSQTTPLREAIDDLNWAPRFEAAWSNLGLGKVLQLASEYAARHLNNARNQQLMRIYTETDPLKQLDLLKAAKGVYGARQVGRNYVGTPAISTSGAVPDALMGLREQPAMTPYEGTAVRRRP